MNHVFVFLNGKHYSIDGQQGRFLYSSRRIQTFSSDVDFNGQRRLTYKIAFEELDFVYGFSSSIKISPEAALAIAQELGYRLYCYLEEPEPKLLIRRLDYILIRNGCEDFTVYFSPGFRWEEEGEAHQGKNFLHLGEAINYFRCLTEAQKNNEAFIDTSTH